MLTYWHKVIQRPINRLKQDYKVYNTDIVIWNDRPINSSSLVIPTLIDKVIHGILVISAGTPFLTVWNADKFPKTVSLKHRVIPNP